MDSKDFHKLTNVPEAIINEDIIKAFGNGDINEYSAERLYDDDMEPGRVLYTLNTEDSKLFMSAYGVRLEVRQEPKFNEDILVETPFGIVRIVFLESTKDKPSRYVAQCIGENECYDLQEVSLTRFNALKYLMVECVNTCLTYSALVPGMKPNQKDTMQLLLS